MKPEPKAETRVRNPKAVAIENVILRRWIRMTIPAYVLLVAVAAGGFWLVEHEASQRVASDRVIVVDEAVSACRDRNQSHEVTRGLIDAAVQGAGTGGDLTKAPSFAKLPPTVQQFVREISTPQPSDGPSTDAPDTVDRLKAYRATLVDEDCEAVGKALRERLEATS